MHHPASARAAGKGISGYDAFAALMAAVDRIPVDAEPTPSSGEEVSV